MRIAVLCLSVLLCSPAVANQKAPSAGAGGESTGLNLLGAPKRSFAPPRSRKPRSSNVDPAQRAHWTAAAMERLRTTPESEPLPAPHFKRLKSGRARYHIKDEARVDFPDGGWLHVVTYSEHESDDVGNAILASDHEGKIYRNNAHVCGGIEVWSADGQKFDSVAEFLAVPIEESPWHGVPTTPVTQSSN